MTAAVSPEPARPFAKLALLGFEKAGAAVYWLTLEVAEAEGGGECCVWSGSDYDEAIQRLHEMGSDLPTFEDPSTQRRFH